jgi:hypothetical protein
MGDSAAREVMMKSEPRRCHMNIDFEQYKAAQLAQGHDEVLVREWEPNLSNEPHTHPFDTQALVVRGEFWLTTLGQTHHLKVGDRFSVPRGQLHNERYGPQGATFWASRKNA